MIALLMVYCASLLVPGAERASWLAEWRSELWYLAEENDRQTWKALGFASGAFPDAWWMMRHREQPPVLRSPWLCLGLLGVSAAALAYWGAASALPQWHSWDAHLTMPVMVFCILPLTTNLDWSDYTVSRRAQGQSVWPPILFLFAKIALLLPIVWFGTFNGLKIVSVTQLQPHATFFGYLFAFRWAFADQKRRCPQCLRLLANPARIGQASYTLTEWYGTELLCSRGHGVLHMPALANNSCSQMTWLRLDDSWSEFFPSVN